MGRIVVVFLIGFLAISGYFFLKNDISGNMSSLPNVFGTTSSASANTWFPKQSSFSSLQNNLELSAKSALVVDYDSGDVIYSKNKSERLPVASTVKIMTAIVALENANPSDIFTISENAASIGENSMGLTEGEKLSLEELLYGTMLVSGNDAAVAISEGVAGSEATFVELMNTKANELGLDDTRFVNASGLDDDNLSQFSTVYDMAVISHYAWEKFPLFRQISSTYNKYIESTPEHKAFDLYNDTNLLTTYPGVEGIKPGFTWEAGWCLVTYAENDGHRILAIVLGSEDRRNEMIKLLDAGFKNFGIEVPHNLI